MASRKEWDPTGRGRRRERFKKDDVIVHKGGAYPAGIYPEDAFRVDEVLRDGRLVAFPLGGGLRHTLPAKEFRKVHEEEKAPVYRPARFTIDWFDGVSFPGWTDGEVWNGWAQPYFDFDQAQDFLRGQDEIVKQKMPKGAQLPWRYDEERDAFILEIKDEDDDVVEAETIVIDGDQKTVYGIGRGYWTWDEVRPGDEDYPEDDE